MPKRKYYNKKTANTLDKLLIIAQKGEDCIHRMDCQEIINFYTRNGFYPKHILARAMELIKLNRVLFPKKGGIKKVGKHYLYAIGDNEVVKVGYSIDPKARLKSLQTGNSRKLRVLWKCYAGSDNKQALGQEKAMHRKIAKFKIKGEWFSSDCMVDVKAWRPRGAYLKDRNDEKLDKQMMFAKSLS